MSLLDKLFPASVAHVHCDIPCGIYDPHAAQIAALTVIRMNQLSNNRKLPGLGGSPADMSAYGAELSRLAATKEQHAELVKREVRIIRGDFFKPENSPEGLGELVDGIMKTASKARQNIDLEAATQLLDLTNQFAEAFWKAKKVATIGPNDETGYDVSGFNKKALLAAGQEVIVQEYFERGTTDFMPVLSKIFAQKPDILNLNGSNPGDCGLILKQARQMGYKGLIVKIGGPGTPEMLKVAGKDLMEGFIYYSPINPDDQNIIEVNKKYDKKFPPPMNGFTPQFYDGTLWLFEAIKKAGTITDTTKVKAALEGLTFNGVYTGRMSWTGKETYGIDHQVKFPFYVMVVKGGKETVLGKIAP